MARQNPLISTRKSSKAFNEFISLAGWLQVVVGNDNPIFLPTRAVAEVMGQSHTAVAMLCKLAVMDGLMELLEKPTQHKATRYRFKVERYKILQNWQGQ